MTEPTADFDTAAVDPQSLTGELLELVDGHAAEMIAGCIRETRAAMLQALETCPPDASPLPAALMRRLTQRVTTAQVTHQLAPRIAALQGADPQTYRTALEADIEDARAALRDAQQRFEDLCRRAADERLERVIGAAP